MNELYNILCLWIDGKNTPKIKKPTLYTINELINICSGSQNTTICLETKKILDLCNIKTVVDGIGWIIVR